MCDRNETGNETYRTVCRVAIASLVVSYTEQALTMNQVPWNCRSLSRREVQAVPVIGRERELHLYYDGALVKIAQCSQVSHEAAREMGAWLENCSFCSNITPKAQLLSAAMHH